MRVGEEAEGRVAGGGYSIPTVYLQRQVKSRGRAVWAPGNRMEMRHTAGFAHQIATELKGPGWPLIKLC